MKKIRITISGMHCASCAGNAESALRKVEGVQEVSVSAMTHKGIIQAEDSVNEDDLKEAITKIGYRVEHCSVSS